MVKEIKNSNGFTLVEMLAAVVIIGILSGVAIVKTNDKLDNAHKEYCSDQFSMFEVAGRGYFNDHLSLLPSAIGEIQCVDLKTLNQNQYIGKLIDYNDKQCNSEKSKVCAMKYNNSTGFYYKVYMDCSACNFDTTKIKMEDSTPTIKFSPNNGTNSGNNDLTITMSIDDEKNQIVSYSYTVYQKSASGDIEVSSIDYQEYKNKPIKIKLNKKGTYYIKASAYNSIGNRGNATSKEYILNYVLSCN